MSHETERRISTPTPTPDASEIRDLVHPDRKPSILERLDTRGKKVGAGALILALTAGLGYGGAKLAEDARTTRVIGVVDTTPGAIVDVPNGTHETSPSSIETQGPYDRIGDKSDMTNIETSQVSEMYSEIPYTTIFNALKDCSQSEIDTIRKVLAGQESAAVMTKILNTHGVATNDWIASQSATFK